MKYIFIIMLMLLLQNTNAQIKINKTETKKDSVHPLLNKSLPAFSGTSVSDRLWNNDSLKGKVVLLNFWFIGCPPCMGEIKFLNELEENYKGTDFILLSIAPNTKEDLLKYNDTTTEGPFKMVRKVFKSESFKYEVIAACPFKKPNSMTIEKNDTSYRLGIDCDNIVDDMFVNAYPTTFIIDKKGIIRHASTGFSFTVPNESVTDEGSKKNIDIKGAFNWSNEMISEYAKLIDELLLE